MLEDSMGGLPFIGSLTLTGDGTPSEVHGAHHVLASGEECILVVLEDTQHGGHVIGSGDATEGEVGQVTGLLHVYIIGWGG